MTVPEPIRPVGPTRDELNKFLEDVSIAISLKTPGSNEIPEIEVPRTIVEYYNRGNLRGFDDVGYFIFNNVKVFEQGKREDAARRDSLTIEQKLFGAK